MMLNDRYALDQRAASIVRRSMASRLPRAMNRAPSSETHVVIMAQIVSHEGAGVYQATEVHWNGGAWASNSSSRLFGTAYGTHGLRHIAADTTVAANTIVRAFCFGSSSTDAYYGQGDWFFQEGGGGTYVYDGPFAVSKHATNVNWVTVGALRSATRPDLCFIVPDAPLTKTGPEHVTVSANGYIYSTVTREGVLALAAPAFAASLPACTATTIPWPLAYVTFSGGAVLTVFQLQYGQIVTYKTISCTCY